MVEAIIFIIVYFVGVMCVLYPFIVDDNCFKKPRKPLLFGIFWPIVLPGIGLYLVFIFIPRLLYRGIRYDSFEKRKK